MTADFNSKLHAYFSQYNSTLSLVGNLMDSKSHPQEILILVCARLDAMANSAGTQDESQRLKFVRFVTHYGGQSQLFGRVSVGDLYHEIGFHRWLLPGLIPKAGRLHNFSDIDREITILLDDSGVELTESAADRLL